MGLPQERRKARKTCVSDLRGAVAGCLAGLGVETSGQGK